MGEYGGATESLSCEQLDDRSRALHKLVASLDDLGDGVDVIGFSDAVEDQASAMQSHLLGSAETLDEGARFLREVSSGPAVCIQGQPRRS